MSWGHPQHDKVKLFVGDILLTAGILLSLSLWKPTGHFGEAGHAAALFVFMLTFLANFYVFDLYNLAALNGVRTIYRLVAACGAATVLCSTWSFFIPWFGERRASMTLSGPFLLAAVSAWRQVYVHTSRLFATRQPLLIIGDARDAENVSAVARAGNSPYVPVGYLHLARVSSTPPLDPEPEAGELVHADAGNLEFPKGAAGAAAAVARARAAASPEPSADVFATSSGVVTLGLATAQRLRQVVAARGVSCLVVRSDAVDPDLVSAITRLRFQGIHVYPLPNFYMRICEELPLEVLSDSWLSFADGFELLHARLFRKVKRLTDLLLASAGLVLSLPLLLLAAAAIKLESPGPVLFRQWRVGWMDRPFQLFKLRSMRNDAEGDGKPRWASTNDPRVTLVGRVLRKFRIDEIPQMINILLGEMSFVGPRPERPEFVEQLCASIPFYRLRHYVPPGVTGWAQVKYHYGASTEDARRKLQFDLYYIRNASPLLDLRILLRTARVVLFRDGSR
jgi:lipopolysaccharide/colanic/teichoic acid biosynthesis glycosyltransferase